MLGPDAQHASRPAGRQRQAADETQHGRRARRHAGVRQQPDASLAAERDADTALRSAETTRAARVGRQQAGQLLGKGPSRAGAVSAIEAPNLQREADLAPSDGKSAGRRQ
jgi:hypothetical protein